MHRDNATNLMDWKNYEGALNSLNRKENNYRNVYNPEEIIC